MVQCMASSKPIHPSPEEALDTDYSKLFEDVSGYGEYRLRQRAFRYIFITGAASAALFAEVEYLPLKYIGKFRCANDDINRIWDVCAYTLHLNMREVLTEAVKRDRWLWAGDSFQAFKFNQYLFHNRDIVRRSLIGLRGKEPFNQHINTITDFSFYWVLALYEYYVVYNDLDFLKFIYPRAESLMRFCADRTNEIGFIIEKYNDWVFIDWADIDKDGAVCAEQMLYIAANRAMAKLASILGKSSAKYSDVADEITKRLNTYFWNDKIGAFIDCYESGKNHVTRHANLLAVLFDIADERQKRSIVSNVILNDKTAALTTPFFKGFELDVMGKIGNMDYVEKALTSYWKGMLDLGATTIWEEYNSNMSGTEHYAMYGDKYAKSLCHAWGASPIYLLGKYFAGVSVNEDGYCVKPYLGNLGYLECTVPLNGGSVTVKMDEKHISVFSTVSGGVLITDNAKIDIPREKELVINNIV